MLYTMTIVDRNKRPLEDIQKRRTIFYLPPEKPSLESSEYWHRYLKDTGQKDQVTHHRVEELEFRESRLIVNNTYFPAESESLEQGV